MVSTLPEAKHFFYWEKFSTNHAEFLMHGSVMYSRYLFWRNRRKTSQIAYVICLLFNFFLRFKTGNVLIVHLTMVHNVQIEKYLKMNQNFNGSGFSN